MTDVLAARYIYFLIHLELGGSGCESRLLLLRLLAQNMSAAFIMYQYRHFLKQETGGILLKNKRQRAVPCLFFSARRFFHEVSL